MCIAAGVPGDPLLGGSRDAPPPHGSSPPLFSVTRTVSGGWGAGVCFVRPLDKINTVCSLEHVRLREEERMGQGPGQAPRC